MNFFILTLWAALAGFLVASGGIVLWMWRHKARYLYGVPGLLWTLNGLFIFSLYLFFLYFPPASDIPRPSLSLSGSIMINQGAWTLAFIAWDLATGWFSFRVLPWLMAHSRRVRMLV